MRLRRRYSLLLSQADPRNESVLVGIRDGVSGKFELHRRQHAKVRRRRCYSMGPHPLRRL